MVGKIICLTLMAIGAIWGAIAYLREGRQRRISLQHRQILDVDQIYERYYVDGLIDRELFVKGWLELASRLRVNPGVLRPTDRFADLKSAVFQPQCDLDDLDVWARVLSRRNGNSRDDLRTVDDFIRLICTSKLA